MLNKVMIIGRLGGDPEVRSTTSGQTVANFTVATSENYKDKSGQKQQSTEWHKIVAWGRLGEICQGYLVKGSLVYLEGKLTTRSWEDKEGIKKYTTEIIINSMEMLSPKNETYTEQNKNAEPVNTPEPVVNNDDDLPF